MLFWLSINNLGTDMKLIQKDSLSTLFFKLPFLLVIEHLKFYFTIVMFLHAFVGLTWVLVHIKASPEV